MTDLDRALRDMMRHRTQDITTVPPHLLTLDRAGAGSEHDADALASQPGAARGYRPVLAVAAAAAVALLAGVLSLVAASRDHASPPAHRKGVPMVTRATCAATVPPSWEVPVRAATQRLPGLSDVYTLAVTQGGGAIVDYTNISDDNVVRLQRAGYLAAGTSSVRPLASFTLPRGTPADTSFNLAVDVDGPTAVISVEVGDALLNIHEIDAVDITTGRRRVVATSSRHDRNQILTQGYVQDGIVYWQTTREGPGIHLRTLARSVGGGPVRVVSTSPLARLEKSALGVEWTAESGRINRPAAVPATVARHAGHDDKLYIAFDTYVTDGKAFAWQAEDGSVEWFSPRSGRVVRVPEIVGGPGGQGTVLAVAGPLVFVQTSEGHQRVIDSRTGASIAMPEPGSFLGSAGSAIGDPILLPASAHVPEGALMRVATADLPPAPC